RLLLLISEDENEIHVDDEAVAELHWDPGAETEQPEPAQMAQLGLHTMNGSHTAHTMRVVGSIDTHPVHILVDGGSSLNFIKTNIAHSLGLTVSPSPTLKVLVGNGAELNSTKGSIFTMDLYLLDLSGPDIVLGTPWLKGLGPIMMDYTQLTMQFNRDSQPITLHGETGPIPSSITFNQFKHLAKHEPYTQLFSLHLSESSAEPHPPSLPTHQNSQIKLLLTKFSNLFTEPSHLPPKRFTDHAIPLLPNAPPVNVRPYRYPHHQKLEIESQISKLMANGWIRPSNSPFSSPVLLLRKKDGTWRMCVDYRALNALTIKDRFPLPTIDELLDELGSARVFTKLDLTSGFHQIRLQSADASKTAFCTHDGHYEYRVMPFGLCNAPATFQATMNDVFRPLLRKTVIVFFDDILVYSESEEAHVQHLTQVFTLLQQHQFYLKSSKLTQSTVAPDPAKIVAITDWPPPRNIKGLRGFLGLSGFYRKFIKNYAGIAQPLTQLLRKDSFIWNDSAQLAFDQLKSAMVTAPILSLPDFSTPFIVQTDASGFAMGAVLIQNKHPIAYFSKSFCPRMMNASTYIRELYAITSAVKKWRQYLLGAFFIIQTDHRSLKELLTQVIQTPEQQHYLAKLLGYHYEIQYKPGSTNTVADALSRSDTTNSFNSYSLSVPHCSFLDSLKQELEIDVEFQSLQQQLQHDPGALVGFKYKDGLIFKDNKIWISPSSKFKELLMREFHETPIAGHAGVEKTMKRLSENFYWDKMKQDVQAFIKQCVVCQKTKYSTLKPAGLLQPLPLPTQIWEDISLDFVTGLPPSQGFTVLLVIVDRFTKGIHLGVLHSGFTAHKVAELFVTIFCKHHGMPKSIVSDRDPIFISHFWRDLFKFSGTLLRMSSSYHPQTDGQTEVMNRTVEQYLRAFAHDKPTTWARFIPWAELHYNTSIHAASGISPYQATYGKVPFSIPTYIPGTSAVDACDSALLSRDEILAVLKNNLLKAQKRMKDGADKHRRDVEFDINTWAYVKLQPYRQISLSREKYHKLSKRYYGPYLILERIGKVAYRLSLPAHSKIHNVFHCSLLKPHQGPPPTFIDQLPPYSIDHHPLATPLAIVATQDRLIDNKLERFVLVQWQGLPPEDTTWENWEELNKIYNLEDKVNFLEEGIDTDREGTSSNETIEDGSRQVG
ncbi:transposon Tf2-1 polyprotein, partial [Trifolium medium]|nr:transposon Tf2-1 polyprotein [Trifolium medium]